MSDLEEPPLVLPRFFLIRAISVTGDEVSRDLLRNAVGDSTELASEKWFDIRIWLVFRLTVSTTGIPPDRVVLQKDHIVAIFADLCST